MSAQSFVIDLTGLILYCGNMWVQLLWCVIDLAITLFFLLHNCAQYKAILKIQLNQRLQEDFYRDFISL